MNLAIHYLKVIGCEASGLVSDEDLVNAVRSETRARDYDGVIVAVGRLEGSGAGPCRASGPASPVAQALGQTADRMSAWPGAT